MWRPGRRAGDQEVSNPLSRQPAGLLRPHPRQKRVSWGRSALPDRNESNWPVIALPTTRRHPTKKSLRIGSDSTCPCTDCSVQVCLQKGPLSSMFLGQRTTAGPRPSCRRSPNFGKVGKIMTHDWRPINHRGDILNNCNVGRCIHFVFYIASGKQLIKIRTQKPNLGLDIPDSIIIATSPA